MAPRALGLLGPAVGLALWTLSGCALTGGPDEAPERVLAAAKERLDTTSGVRIDLRTEELPRGVVGLAAAEGVGIHPAGFEGTFQLRMSGIPVTAEVVAVGGETYATHPMLLPEWTPIDPERYGAPDPAALMSPTDGISGILTAAVDPEQGESVRAEQDLHEVLTEYVATVPAAAIEPFLPTAEGDFEAVFTVAEGHELREAVLTGVFYAGEDPLTYTVTLSEYGLERDISAP